MGKRLDEFTTLTFDCYGTLIDWETGIWDAMQPLMAANGADIERGEGLAAYARAESSAQAEHPGMVYPQILARAHRAMAAELGLKTNDELDMAFGASLPHWPAFPDTAGALRKLKRRYKLVILSNVDRAGFAASNRKLGVAFDAVYTAEDVGSYKPDPPQLHLYARAPEGRSRRVEGANPAHRAVTLPRPRPGARSRPCQCLDRPSGAFAKATTGAPRQRSPSAPKCDFVFPDMISLARAAGLA